MAWTLLSKGVMGKRNWATRFAALGYWVLSACHQRETEFLGTSYQDRVVEVPEWSTPTPSPPTVRIYFEIQPGLSNDARPHLSRTPLYSEPHKSPDQNMMIFGVADEYQFEVEWGQICRIRFYPQSLTEGQSAKKSKKSARPVQIPSSRSTAQTFDLRNAP